MPWPFGETYTKADGPMVATLRELTDAGRPLASLCRCVTWPCPCACHEGA